MSTTTALRVGCLLAVAAFGCTKAMFEPIDSGLGGAGSGGGTAGDGGDGGTAGGGSGGGGDGGGAGGAIAGSGGSGGRGGIGGSAATGGTGGSAGAGGAGGAAGVGGSGGTAGSAGRGGVGGSAGSGGTAGTAGGGGRGGTGGTNPDGGIVTPSVAGQIVITELMHNTATVSDDLGEWFEVYNPSPTVSYDLMGCQVLDSSLSGPVIPVSLVLPPMTFRTLAVSDTPGGIGVPPPFTPDFVYGLAVKFDNGAGERAGISCSGVLIDEFIYPTALSSGSGHAFNLDPRHYNAVDNDTTTFYCPSRDTMPGDAYESTGPNYGTPGRANTQCPQVTQ